ncbi:hypothetical protein [Streptomyces sp. NPDC007856]|uniref:hypothetical protein n=1 Tax=Streptomyces sp. NPDC007856 TaxID=3364781 RepID=UPI0036CBD926
MCGPLHGPQVDALHARFRACRRLAAEVDARLSGRPAGAAHASRPGPAWPRTTGGCATAEQFLALVARCDLVFITRLPAWCGP